MEDIKVYTLREVEAILKVTQRTLYNYIKGGQLKAVKLGRNWRVTEEALREFLNTGTMEGYTDKL